MNFCGLRSTSGNHELCTCTMISMALAKRVVDVRQLEGDRGGLAGDNGSGFSKLLRNLARNGSPRTSC